MAADPKPVAGGGRPAPDPDRDLVDAARAGEFSAFDRLVARHERRVYTLARRIVGQTADAEDVVQETFLSAMEHLGGFRGDASFSTWLLRIATNHALKALRRRRTRSETAAVVGEPAEAAPPHPEFIAPWREEPGRIAQRSETARTIETSLQALDDKYRAVFVLRDIEGLSVRETAQALGLSPVNVKVRLLRARLMLRERLTRIFGDDAARVYPDPAHRH